MSNSNNSANEDTRTDQEKAIDKTAMYLRMAIRQLQSGDWTVKGEAVTTTPVAVGENVKGLTTYKSAVRTLAIELVLDVDDAHEDAPVTEFGKTPAEAKTLTEVKN